MLVRTLLLVLLSIPITTGCTTMVSPSRDSLADVRTRPRAGSALRVRRPAEPGKDGDDAVAGRAPREPRIVRTSSGPHDEHDGWLVRARRRLDQVSREIEADLNFHESEGLDGFAPDAADQVNMLRGDMNGLSGLPR